MIIWGLKVGWHFSFMLKSVQLCLVIKHGYLVINSEIRIPWISIYKIFSLFLFLRNDPNNDEGKQDLHDYEKEDSRNFKANGIGVEIIEKGSSDGFGKEVIDKQDEANDREEKSKNDWTI